MALVDRVRDFICRRRLAYLKTFDTPYGQDVLRDLARFCYAHKSTFYADERAHAVAEGRREVWLRVQNHLRLTDEQLWALHGAAPTTTTRSGDD